MPEVIMQYDLDESGKMVNLVRKEEVTRCRDCGFCVRDECCRVGHVVKPDGFCREGGREVSKTYEDGLEDAWKAARRICMYPEKGGLELSEMKKIFGTDIINNIFSAYDAVEAVKRLEEYDKPHFEVGDVVKSLGLTRMVMGTKGVVTGVDKISGGCWVIWSCGQTGFCDPKDIEKTTTHFSSITKIMENLKYLEDNS